MERRLSLAKKPLPGKDRPFNAGLDGVGDHDFLLSGGAEAGENSAGGGGMAEEEKRAKFGSPSMAGNYARKGGGVASGTQPCCLVERCTADLGEAKRYYRRHKVCEAHSKAPVVVVAGLRQRFCQQCSRFHELSEFDEVKRSCRRRLVGHNERRRKSSCDSLADGSSHLRAAD